MIDLWGADQLAKQLDVCYLETSAKNAINVEHTFVVIAKNIKRKIDHCTTSVNEDISKKIQFNP